MSYEKNKPLQLLCAPAFSKLMMHICCLRLRPARWPRASSQTPMDHRP